MSYGQMDLAQFELQNLPGSSEDVEMQDSTTIAPSEDVHMASSDPGSASNNNENNTNGNNNIDYGASLLEVFSLMAYPDPFQSPMSYVLDLGRREALATSLNSAIQEYLSKRSSPSLELICKHLRLAVNCLISLDECGVVANSILSDDYSL